MKLHPDGQVVLSPSDLTQATKCEWGFVRKLEGVLGLGERPAEEKDAMAEIASRLGAAHERGVLDDLRKEHDGDVAEIANPIDGTTDYWEGLAQAVELTREALNNRRRVIYQGAFFDGEFQGFADFLVWSDQGYYEVRDSKLSRSAKVPALLQLAAYADQLRALGIPVGPRVSLALGTGEHSHHLLDDIEPVYRIRMRRLREIVAERQEVASKNGAPATWRSEHYEFCADCLSCEGEINSHDDLLQVADMRRDQRAKIMAHGLLTLADFAQSEGPIPNLNPRTLQNLRAQARAQQKTKAHPDGVPFVEVDRPDALRALPDPSRGDIFFDFEGDPLYQEGKQWGLDYLFGWVNASGEFDHIWADSFDAESKAFERFVDLVLDVRERYPDMHVYHYASYEKTHLLQLAQRHGTREEEVDQLVREHVLVNLLPLVKNSVRLGLPSYSIKYLERVYLSDVRTGETLTAGDSVADYHRYRAALDGGDRDSAQKIKQSVLDYNHTDCESTRALFTWLLSHRQVDYIAPVPREADADSGEEPDHIRDELRGLIAEVPVSDRTANETAIALAAEAVEYHAREKRTFWWSHFRRLSDPVVEWEDERGVVMVDDTRVVRDWEPKRTLTYRQLEITGRFAPGTNLKPKDKPFVIYEPTPGPLIDPGNPFARGVTGAEVVESGDGVVVLKESARVENDQWSVAPLALVPGRPPSDKELKNSIREWGLRILESLPKTMPDDPALDILRREPPRGTIVYPEERESTAEAIADTVSSLNNSYLAVQGPPGTGKTYNGAQVIAMLSAAGWKVGVVAQSHAAIENVLQAVAEAGVPRSIMGKKLGTTQTATGEEPWLAFKDNAQVAGFLEGPGGRVIGGTAWLFANPNGVKDKGLDLLVIEEAGQYSLANTVAVSRATTRLLLLGDPQQLSEVSQGSHPEPINMSALSWLSAGHDVLPRELGIFLDTTRRMHPALCEVVSKLSYEGRLGAHPHPDRHLEGIEPGLHLRPVHHRHNSVESVEEAKQVVSIVASVFATPWSKEGATKPLGEWEKGLIVVAPYNAQVNLIRQHLDEAGYHGVPVGTVDRFQGQEAVVSIVSMAASSLQDVSRGIEFLLERNRLNVAISRAQWASYLVFSPELHTFTPQTPASLGLLSRFAGISGA